MKNIKLILSFCLLLAITFSCIKKKESNEKAITANKAPVKNWNTKKNPAAKTAAALTPEQIERQKAFKAWKEKVAAANGMKNTNVSKSTASATAPAPVATKVNTQEIQSIKAELNKPVALKTDKGNFLTEITTALSLSPENTSALDELIKKYQRKGMDLRFFGAFYKNTKKPFAKELKTVFNPLQFEQFKHFHAYWFDRIPYPKPDMPVSLFYRLNLSKEQFTNVSKIYSQASVDMSKLGKNDLAGINGIRAKYEKEINGLLNSKQKEMYKRILSVAF